MAHQTVTQRRPRSTKARQQAPASSSRAARGALSRPGALSSPWPWLLAVIVAAVFSRTLFQAFSPWDDSLTVFANPYFNPVTLNHLLQLWTHPYQQEQLYVPLSFTILGAIAALSHSDTVDLSSQSHFSPAPFHLANLGFHVANTILVYVILRALVRRDLPALAGALLFGLHPLQVESVAWIPELRGLSCAFFCLLAIRWYLLYLAALREGQAGAARYRPYALALVAGTLAMLCKPAAISLPLVFVVLDRWQTGRPLLRGVRAAAPLLVPAIAIYLVTYSMQPVLAQLVAPLPKRPFVAGDALAFYLTKLVAPFNLAIVYGRTPREVLSHWWGYLTWLLPAGLAVVMWLRRRDLPWLAAGGLISLVALLPNSGLAPFAFQVYSTVADRYAYLALLGPALIVAFVLAKVKTQALLWIGAAVLLYFAVLSVMQTGYWDNSLKLWGHAVEVSGSDQSYLNYGLQQAANGMQVAAAQSFRRSIALDATNPLAHTALGTSLQDLGRFPEAIAQLRQAIALDSSRPEPHFKLGVALLETGRQKDGLAELRESIRLTTDPAKKKQLQQALAKLIRGLQASH
jgi:hypothetical protein